MMTKQLLTIVDGKTRCGWVGAKPHFIVYHDCEWGVPIHDDRKHFEMLLLEGAQAGLTWETILLRLDGYRRAFAEFDPKKVARFMAKKKAALLKSHGIIRNRLKIDSAVTNAQAFLAVQEEFGSFDRYVWRFVDGEQKVNLWVRMSQVPAMSPESDALSKDLKKRGFRFVGSTLEVMHDNSATLRLIRGANGCCRHETHTRRRPSHKPDISTVGGTGHFYFGSTRAPTHLDFQ